MVSLSGSFCRADLLPFLIHDVQIRDGIDGTDGTPGSWFVGVGQNQSDDCSSGHHGKDPEGKMGKPNGKSTQCEELRQRYRDGNDQKESWNQHGRHIPSSHLNGGQGSDAEAHKEISKDIILQLPFDEGKGDVLALLCPLFSKGHIETCSRTVALAPGFLLVL